jgi:hypothetical protein
MDSDHHTPRGLRESERYVEGAWSKTAFTGIDGAGA